MAREMQTLGPGLALSGGGFRATLFNLGALWRLNELGWLKKLAMITSVSGGSIVSGVLGFKWRKLTFDANGVATNFQAEVAAPVRHFCTQSIDVTAGLEGLANVFESIPQRVAAKYREELFGNATLQDLPDPETNPRFVLYATSLQSGASVRMSRKHLADYRVGRIPAPAIPLATAVAASSAFPPVLSPVTIDFDPAVWENQEGADLYPQVEFRRRLFLTDGGVYDNMGLEAIWDRCKIVLVSDAGAPFSPEAAPERAWTSQVARVLDIATEQTRRLRRSWLVGDFKEKRRHGTYWGIATRIGDYGLADSLARDSATTQALQHVRTRLNPFSDTEQCQLINWGYALADAAMRSHVLETPAAKGALPYAAVPL
jgi:NTE family protein